MIDSTRKGITLVELLIGYFELLDTFVSSGMYISVQCTEDAPFVSEEDAEAALAAHPDIRGAFFEPQLSAESCEIWDAPLADEVEDEAVESDVPALVLAGAYDPITPPRGASRWRKRWSRRTTSSFRPGACAEPE